MGLPFKQQLTPKPGYAIRWGSGILTAMLARLEVSFVKKIFYDRGSDFRCRGGVKGLREEYDLMTQPDRVPATKEQAFVQKDNGSTGIHWVVRPRLANGFGWDTAKRDWRGNPWVRRART